MEFLKKIDFKKYFTTLDDLARKIPDNIASFLKNIVLIIFILLLAYAAYRGWHMGTGSAKQYGQDLARDTRTLFQEEIEKDYNRKRTDIRMPSASELIGTDNYAHEMQYEYHTLSKNQRPVNSGLSEPDRKLLESKRQLRKIGDKNSTPLLEMNGEQLTVQPSYIPGKSKETPKDTLPLGDSKLTLDRKNSADEKILDRGTVDLKDKPEPTTEPSQTKPVQLPEEAKTTPLEYRKPTRKEISEGDLLPVGE